MSLCALPQAATQQGAFSAAPQAALGLNTHMRTMLYLGCAVLLGACVTPVSDADSVSAAQPYIGLSEYHNRSEIQDFTGVDPVHVEWCAAFVNAVLDLDGIPGSDSVSDHPLLARSFLFWGEAVEPEHIQRGDVVVFPRGSSDWKGHVGFFVAPYPRTGEWIILGGNQDNTVSYQLYDPSVALGIRRHRLPVSIHENSTGVHPHN